MFELYQTAKRADTGEVVRVVEILPNGMVVFYRIQYEDGNTSLVLEGKLRRVF